MLTHGAGSNCESPLLVAIAEAFAARDVAVLRIDLPFRQRRRSGPPFPAQATADREGLRAAVAAMRQIVNAELYLGGHSYGGRQASMLASEEPDLVCGLLLLSYPLHPPDKPDQLRTHHFTVLRTKPLFFNGKKDQFVTIEELRRAMALIPAKTLLKPIDGAGHDLKRGKIPATDVVASFLDLSN